MTSPTIGTYYNKTIVATANSADGQGRSQPDNFVMLLL
jgi:hypothetical protein